MERTSRHNLPYIMPSQAQKHVPVNEAIRLIDQLISLVVTSKTINIEPSPTNDTCYIIPANASGTNWDNAHINDIACFIDNGWQFITPVNGYLAFNLADDKYIRFNGNQWIEFLPTSNPNKLGINTQADDYNRLSVKSNAVLFTALNTTNGTGELGAGDQRVILNKSAKNHTTSINFQSNYKTKIEMGLLGNNNFCLQSSKDGTNFDKIFSIDPVLKKLHMHENFETWQLNQSPLGIGKNLLENSDFSLDNIHSNIITNRQLALERWIIDAKTGQITIKTKQSNNIQGKDYLRINIINTSNKQTLEQNIYTHNFFKQNKLSLSFKSAGLNCSISSFSLHVYKNNSEVISGKFYEKNTGDIAVAPNLNFNQYYKTLDIDNNFKQQITIADFLKFKVTFTGSVNNNSYLDLANIQLETGDISSLYNLEHPSLNKIRARQHTQIIWVNIPASPKDKIIAHNMGKQPVVTGGGAGFNYTHIDNNHLKVTQSNQNQQKLTLQNEII